MFRKRHVWLCACLSAVFSGVTPAAPSIADEPKHSIADAPRASIVDGESHEVRTRLGKFGPMATVKLPPFKVMPRFEGVTGYTDTGRPISRRKKLVLDQARALAAQWEDEYQQAVKEGRVKPRPKVKTQAERWAEENERILEEERKYGRKTTQNFVIPGMTPEQSRQIREAKTGGVVTRGGVQVHTILPTEEDFATGRAKRMDPTPEQRAAMEARSRANQESAFALKYQDGDLLSKGATHDMQTYFPDIPASTNTNAGAASRRSSQSPNVSPHSREILNAFPDSGRSEETRLPSSRSEGRAVQPAGTPVSSLGRLFDHAAQWLTGAKPAMAAQADFHDNTSLGIEANPMSGAFEAIAKQLAEDKKAFEKTLKENDPSSPAKGQSQDKTEGNCDSCRLTPDDFERAAQAAKAAKAVSDRPEGRALKQTESKVMEDIVAVLNDPTHPASFVNMMRKALEENPVVEARIPDARERLGMETKASKPQNVTYVFVSYSLGDDVLNDILSRNAGRDDVTLVMRGIPKGVSLGDGIKHMQMLASQYDPIPNIVLDPTLFSKYEVKAVPSVVRVQYAPGLLEKLNFESRMQGKEGPAHPPLIAKVDGLHNDQWLNEKIELENCSEAYPCRFGEQGPVYRIDEPDMIEEMKRRVAQIDWEKKKAEAMKRFWTNQTFDELPLAEKSVRRVLDPSIHVVADINDANGNPVRRAGEVVNPLEARPFNSVLVIFNPKREAEMEAVLDKVKLLRAEGFTQFIYMATAFDRSKAGEDKTLGPGWWHYEAVCDRLNSHVFLLTPEVKDRWDVRATPTFVTADNTAKRFIIEEVAPRDVSSKESK